MLGGRTRDARRTERYLDELLSADERHASGIPVDVEMDPAVLLAARELQAGLTRVHPSFRFEEALAARLAAGAARLRAGLSVEDSLTVGALGSLSRFRSRPLGGDLDAPALVPPGLALTNVDEVSSTPPGRIPAFSASAAFHRLPEMASRPSRPLIVGGVGVGVASAAISLGAVYVAWRHSHTSSARMGRAVRAAHGRTSPGRGRRAGVINEILGVMS